MAPRPEIDDLTSDAASGRESPPTEPLLQVRHLRKRFGAIDAVRDVSLSIAPGETYGLLGPNGAGKTSAISMIAGILSRDGGDVTLGGRPMGPGATAARADLGLVPQDLAIYPDLTARENLRFFGRLYGLGGATLRARVEEVLRVVELADRANDRVREFSGGMKRRLNIAAGLMHRPRLLILDEPTVGVDPQSRNAILASIEALSTEGMAVLYTTHYMEEAERLCDRVGIIDEGVIKAEGSQRELVRLVGEQDRVEIEATGSVEAAAEAARMVAGVESVTLRQGGMSALASDAAPLLAPLLTRVSEAGAVVSGVTLHQADLETVFLHLTGKALRD